jgi:hypothetical protein
MAITKTKFKVQFSKLNPQRSHDVAANFSLRVFFGFNALPTQAEACGYQHRTFAGAFEENY